LTLKKNKKILVYYPLAVYWSVLFVMTSLPSVKFVEKLKISDKIEHFFAYAVLGLLLTLALHMQNKFERLNSNYGFWSVVIIAIYAALDEIHQLFIPNRSGEILDWLADFLGALIASLLIRKFIKRFSEPVSTELSS